MSRLFTFLMIIMLSVLATGADFEYNTAGTLGFSPDLFGSSLGWGQWFITSIQNNTSHNIQLVEFGFPCCGSVTGSYGWVVWQVDGLNPPPGSPTTAEYHGSFVPVEGPSGDPSVYTYVNVSSQMIVIPSGSFFCFGYQNTSFGGQTGYNGQATWAWDQNAWLADSDFNRTAVLQVTGQYSGSLQSSTWAGIKSLF